MRSIRNTRDISVNEFLRKLRKKLRKLVIAKHMCLLFLLRQGIMDIIILVASLMILQLLFQKSKLINQNFKYNIYAKFLSFI